MGAETGISWTGSTWNPIVGCSKVSPGCANCYAETLALRWGWTPKPWLPENGPENVILKPERLDQPLRWKRPRKIFVNSLSDVFHEQVPDEFIDQMYAVMARAPWHTFQVLTKRPERMRAYVTTPGRRERVIAATGIVLHGGEYIRWPLRNVWAGTSVENARWRTRIDDLRETPSAVRFLSCEPLLGPLDNVVVKDAAIGFSTDSLTAAKRPKLDLTGIDWVIVGGESGPGARPMKEEWVRDILAECRRQGVAFWMKQFGEVWSRANLGHGGHAANMDEFPKDLRIQEFPAADAQAAEQGAFAF
jgi:protein gp37